ncbi:MULTISPECIES: GNAT family N-acetyltransferase [unclassified Actinotalea]|uniref:GNAT family N-acetyltransferase n=1 Tax=unclassified Actinotalea TaxID=2638618 RepID=UPI0015F37C0B
MRRDITVEDPPWQDVPPGPFITDLFVLPEIRRRGIGRALVQAVQSALPTGIGLRVDDSATEAHALYVSLGFRPATYETRPSSLQLGSRRDGPRRVPRRRRRERRRDGRLVRPGAARPVGAAHTLLGTQTLRDNPARWLGGQAPDLAIGAATGGAGIAAGALSRAGERWPTCGDCS